MKSEQIEPREGDSSHAPLVREWLKNCVSDNALIFRVPIMVNGDFQAERLTFIANDERTSAYCESRGETVAV